MDSATSAAQNLLVACNANHVPCVSVWVVSSFEVSVYGYFCEFCRRLRLNRDCRFDTPPAWLPHPLAPASRCNRQDPQIQKIRIIRQVCCCLTIGPPAIVLRSHSLARAQKFPCSQVPPVRCDPLLRRSPRGRSQAFLRKTAGSARQYSQTAVSAACLSHRRQA